MSVNRQSFEDEGKRILRMGDEWNEGLFRKAFVGCTWVCHQLWLIVNPLDTISPFALPKHLLWAMMIVQMYIDEEVLAVVASVTEVEFKLWAWRFLRAISAASELVVSLFLIKVVLVIMDNNAQVFVLSLQFDLNSRHNNLRGRPAALSEIKMMIKIVTCPIKIRSDHPRSWCWLNVNNAVQYEVGRHISTGRICWLNGPYDGSCRHPGIFRHRLKPLLDENEKVLSIHSVDARQCSHPRNQTYNEERQAERCYRLQESLTKKLKSFGATSNQYFHPNHLETHGHVFKTAAMISDLLHKKEEQAIQLTRVFSSLVASPSILNMRH